MEPQGVRSLAVQPTPPDATESLGALFSTLGDAVLFARFPDRQILDVNPAFCRLFGVTREEALRSTTEVMYASREDFARMGALIEPAMREGRPVTIQFRFGRRDGTTFPGEMRFNPVRAFTGDPVGAVSIIRDLTEQRALEAEHAAQHERLEALLNAQSELGNAILVVDARGVEWANDAFCGLVGLTLDELRHGGIDPWGLLGPEDPADRDRLAALHEGTGTAAADRFEARLRHRSGREVPVEVAAKPERPGPGARVVAVLRDISQRKAHEASLRENARAFATLAAATASVSAQLELEKLVQAITDGAVRITGASFGAYFYNVADAKGQSYQLYTLSGAPREAFSSFPMPRKTAVFAPTFEGRGPIRSDDITKDERYGRALPHRGMPEGHLPVRSYLAVPVRLRDGGVHGGLFLGHPEPGRFTEQHERLAETLAAQAAVAIDNARLYEAARASEHRLRAVFEHAPVQVVTTDAQARVLEMNRTLGGHAAEDILGRRVYDVVVPEDRARVRETLEAVMRSGEPEEYEVRAANVAGDVRWYRVHAAALDHGGERGAILMASDITSSKEAELELVRVRAQLSQGEKLAALGGLVSGVAHELRTPLTFLGTNAFLAQQRIQRVARQGGSATDALAQAQPFFEEVMAAIDRINLLIEDLRKYTRARGQDEVFDERLDEVVGEAVQLFRATNRSTHRIHAEYAPTRATRMRRGAIQQLVLNLLQNAVEASPSGSEVRIRVRESEQGPEVEVEDDGTGMPEALVARIYEPLFTTKRTGTGLGLTIVRRIADEHGATIACESEPGRGTRFLVRLPWTA